MNVHSMEGIALPPGPGAPGQLLAPFGSPADLAMRGLRSELTCILPKTTDLVSIKKI